MSLTRNQTVISVSGSVVVGQVAKPLRSKSAPNRCMKMQSWVLLRTGNIKRARRRGARSGHEDRIAWLRKLIAWQEEMADSGEMLDEEVRSQVFDDRVYVFTRKVMSLICLRDQRRWTSLTTSTVMSDAAASGQKLAGALCRSPTSCRWATRLKLSPRNSRTPAVTG